MELSEEMAQIDKLNLRKSPKLIPSQMTDEELVMADLKARGILKG